MTRTRGAFRRIGVVLLLSTALFSFGARSDPGVAAAATSNDVPANALGPFVGYSRPGITRSIGAEWRVPKILQSSESHASTWIGLQNESGAFIQVGTTEDVFTQRTAGLKNGTYYAGFWSDDGVEFRPMPTFTQAVRPGDLMTASISKAKGGWRVVLVDRRTQASFARTLAIGAAVLTEAEWNQEDPTDIATDLPLPYPRLSRVRFSNLELNGYPPQVGLSDEVWMSVPGEDFAPTALKDDSYSVVPIHLNPVQIRWVTAEVPYHTVAAKFDDEEAEWREHPPTSESAKREIQPFLQALVAYENTLANGSWAMVPRPDLDRLIVAFSQDAAALTALADAEPKPSPGIINRLDQTRDNLRSARQGVTNRMGLP